jgi:AcrR family transcriptional regulator
MLGKRTYTKSRGKPRGGGIPLHPVRGDTAPVWIGEPLPRGRHKLSPEAVRASQRARLVRAMTELVGRQGYEATTVPQVVSAARVSAATFYRFFTDKTDCFLAVCDEAVDEILDRLMAVDTEDWLVALHRGVDVYLHWFQDQPALTRAYLVELPIAGARAAAQRDTAYDRFRAVFADLAHRARAENPALPPLSPVALTVVVIAPTEVVAEQVRRGNTATLTSLHDEIVGVIVKLLADDETAQRALALEGWARELSAESP